MPQIRTIMAQLDFLVGDISGNGQKIIDAIIAARDTYKADLIVFPELALTGYPPEDLLYRRDLYDQIEGIFPKILAETDGIHVILGYPEYTIDGCFNQASLIQNKKIIQHYRKQILPNYSVFDEKRYFKPGYTPCIATINDIPVAITICEDLWYPRPMIQAKEAGAKLMISINASPFATDKAKIREAVMTKRAREGNMPIIYVNCVGGQDELVFDGGSLAINAQGQVIQQADYFATGLFPVDIILDQNSNNTTIIPLSPPPSAMSEEARIYNALVLGVRDYIEKNHFPRAVIGLSGGIDSALTLAIAVDAIGADRVETVMMPSRFTSNISLEDAKKQAALMKVEYHILSIEPVFNAFLNTLADQFKGLKADTTEENLQARCRGTLLMAISNKKHAIVLATGNKSEMAVGYSTLYGDMVGGFCVLKDVFKTLVFKLAAYRNTISPVIPQRVIDRPPSAELAEDQKDQDYLPPYDILDAILARYIEHDEGIEKIIAAGFDAETVKRVMVMVDRNEYKRRQSAPGVRITERAFGKDRRYPITSGFNAYRK